MLKSIGQQFIDRVWRSYKSTLIGLGIGAAVIGLDVVAGAFDASTSPWAKGVAALAVLIGASLRSKALPPPAP